NKPSLAKFLPGVRPGGVVIYNSSLVDEAPYRDDVAMVAVPATEIANELGEVRAANMVALGALLARTAVVDPEDVLAALAKALPKHRQDLLPLNRVALERGRDYGG
ncbi:MAG: 2-oxoacid:acceptor oxidoreductase family protein, partial [Firmicutes bacterium]|nr:2-oxoacid:acceptor oxidoreductase family protein [Bacillota bacterium]